MNVKTDMTKVDICNPRLSCASDAINSASVIEYSSGIPNDAKRIALVTCKTIRIASFSLLVSSMVYTRKNTYCVKNT